MVFCHGAGRTVAGMDANFACRSGALWQTAERARAGRYRYTLKAAQIASGCRAFRVYAHASCFFLAPVSVCRNVRNLPLCVFCHSVVIIDDNSDISICSSFLVYCLLWLVPHNIIGHWFTVETIIERDRRHYVVMFACSNKTSSDAAETPQTTRKLGGKQRVSRMLSDVCDKKVRNSWSEDIIVELGFAYEGLLRNRKMWL